jgi:hypothetical protein
MAGPFATSFDVAARWRPLSTADADRADVLCEDASTLIRARFPGIDAQTASGAVDPNVLKIVVAGMVKRAMIAPDDGVSQESQAMGPYNQSQTFANPLQNVFLTAADMVLILGYQPSASSHKFGNTTTRSEEAGPGYVYGYGGL